MHFTRAKIEGHSTVAGKGLPFFQPKLNINQPGDIYEQEADAMAEKVILMSERVPKPFFSGAVTPLQKKCGACEKEEEKIQRKPMVPDIQKDDDEKKEGVAFKPFLPGITGHWPGFGFNADVSNLQLDFGSLMNKRLSLGLNFPGEPYAAISGKDYAFKLGYDFAENNLFAGGRYKGFNYGLMAGLENPAFGLALGYGHMPLFNYNMRTALQFGNTPLPYDSMYANELGRTGAAIGNWKQGGATDPERFISVVGEAGNFGSMTGDLFDVADKPKYDWGGGVNVGYDPQLQWYFIAGVKFYLGKEDQKKTKVSPKFSGSETNEKLELHESNGEEAVHQVGMENYINNLDGSGSSLPNSSKEFFESRFGYDFSNVRVHDDPAAEKSAQSINALAYTSGNNIVFNKGQYSPGTDTGNKLLAHELTHVVQQTTGRKTIDAGIQLQQAPSVATPMQRGATAVRTGGFVLTIGYVTITVLPDVRNSQREQPRGAHTYFTFSPPIAIPNPDYKLNATTHLVDSFVPYPALKVGLTVETNYGSSVNPAGPSDYGYGTRPQDTRARNNTIAFHEGSHGNEFISYIRREITRFPLPVFQGAVGMTEADFLKKDREYVDQVGKINQMLIAASKFAEQIVDCAGISIDQFNARRPGYQNVCP